MSYVEYFVHLWISQLTCQMSNAAWDVQFSIIMVCFMSVKLCYNVFSSDTLVSHILKSSTMLLKSVSLKFAIRLMGPSLCHISECLQRHRPPPCVTQLFKSFLISLSFSCHVKSLASLTGRFNCTCTNERAQSDFRHTKRQNSRGEHCVSLSVKLEYQHQGQRECFVCLCVTNANVYLCCLAVLTPFVTCHWWSTVCCLAVLSHCNQHLNPLPTYQESIT